MNIVAICGSLRTDSANRKLLAVASRHATALGAIVTEAPIGDLPLYNEDIDIEPWPTPVRRFYDQLAAADAVLIVSPEYNYSIPGGLKNAVDWGSVGSNAWKGKAVALMGVSSGQYGTTKMQMHLRQSLTGTGTTWVVPQPQVALGPSATVFSADGSLADAAADTRVRELLSNLIALAAKMK